MNTPARHLLRLRRIRNPATRARTFGRRDDEQGYVAVLIVLLASSVLFGSAALGVDVARWYVEVQRVQKAADAAALGGVTYLPQDYDSAVAMANTVSSRNGYPNSGTSTVTVQRGAKASQIKVTVCNTIQNSFGALLGTATTKICRAAVADFTGPAPMGSPCNTFGNEPGSGGGTSSPTPVGTARSSSPFSNCATSNPQFWATVEGPQTDKIQGDRYSTLGCNTGTSVDGCTSGSSNNNSEYNDAGYFWLVRVQPDAVGQPIDLQLYDPTFVSAGQTCTNLAAAANWSDAANPYVTDGKKRYGNDPAATSSTGSPYCTGDSFPGGGSTLMTTSFALRQQTDTLNPNLASVQDDTAGQACIKQFTGQTTTPVVNDLTSTKSTYDDQLAATFHNWYSLCRFTPARAGDYYLQVRSNVSPGGTALPNTNGNASMIFTGNANAVAASGNTTAGYGANSFGIRAVTASGLQNSVSVSGYDKMPIFVNASGATSTFNLIRVPSAGAGKSIAFSFFDAGDATSSGTVKVLPPTDATGSITSTPFPNGGCKAVGGNAGSGGSTLTNCTAPISNATNNGKTETIGIPIPSDYACTDSSLGGCWYRVQVSFTGATSVTDTTTWTASVSGDPVRLIE